MPTEVDRGLVEQLGSLAREWQRLDLAVHVDRLEDGVVAHPRRRAVCGGAVHLDAQGEHALGLDADAQVGRLAGDREVAHVALRHNVVRAAVEWLIRLLVGYADEVDPDGGLGGELPDGAHHRREAALHVVGAAADQAVAVDARLELAGPPGHDVDVAVEDDRRTVRGADRGGEDRQAAGRDVLHVDLVRLQPALDEAGGRLDPVDG